LEAFASGVAVVASAVGGLPEMVDPGRTGLLFQAGDVAALAAALSGLLADRAARERLVREARRMVVENYSLERMAADYGCHYRELLERLGRRIQCAS
jgi:glycosyltransferase involved in cell wall biosynthesis